MFKVHQDGHFQKKIYSKSKEKYTEFNCCTDMFLKSMIVFKLN